MTGKCITAVNLLIWNSAPFAFLIPNFNVSNLDLLPLINGHIITDNPNSCFINCIDDMNDQIETKIEEEELVVSYFKYLGSP